jgi:hypothetical protein
VDEPGLVTLRWSNFFSFISAKVVRYRVRLTYVFVCFVSTFLQGNNLVLQ